MHNSVGPLFVGSASSIRKLHNNHPTMVAECVVDTTFFQEKISDFSSHDLRQAKVNVADKPWSWTYWKRRYAWTYLYAAALVKRSRQCLCDLLCEQEPYMWQTACSPGWYRKRGLVHQQRVYLPSTKSLLYLRCYGLETYKERDPKSWWFFRFHPIRFVMETFQTQKFTSFDNKEGVNGWFGM